MIIRINPLESTVELFYERYVRLHGFIKLEAESVEKCYILIVQIARFERQAQLIENL